jgi:hypothetical protein
MARPNLKKNTREVNYMHAYVASLCSLAGRYDNPIPYTRFQAPIDCSKIATFYRMEYSWKAIQKSPENIGKRDIKKATIFK